MTNETRITYKILIDKIKENKPFLISASTNATGVLTKGEIGWDPETPSYLFFLSNTLNGYPSDNLIAMSRYKYSYAFLLTPHIIDVYEIKFLKPFFKKLSKLKIL